MASVCRTSVFRRLGYLLLFMCLSLVCIIFSIIIAIAFVTVWERHLLSVTQGRLGPGKTLFSGGLTAVLDGLKLITKGILIPIHAYGVVYFIAPSVGFLVIIIEWISLPLISAVVSFESSVLFFTCCTSLMVFSTLLAGFLSGGKYSTLGALRVARQVVRYEVALLLMIVIVLILNRSFQWVSCSQVLIWGLFPTWITVVLAETNRAPFDFAEGERELVSGFNTEYSGVPFILLFLAEYGSILSFSFLTRVIFFSSSLILTFLTFSLIILVRSSFPRLRYDYIMTLMWTRILPFLLFVLPFIYLLSLQYSLIKGF